MTATKPTFKSYVDIDLTPQEPEMSNGTPPTAPEPHAPPTPILVPGEVIYAEAPCIVKYSLFTNQNKGLNGTLFCTNFRVAYVTSVLEESEPDWKKNRLMAENDIPLACVDSLYQVTKGKRKKLAPGSKVPKRPKIFEIHCKDFRVHVFCMKFADKAKTKTLVNEILKVAYPSSEKSLFGFSYKGNRDVEVEELTFQTPGDWDQELRRMGAKNWKTVQINQNYLLSLVLPEVLVVPMMSRSPELKQAAAQFVSGRLPTWSYTLPNQASLVRMAELIPSTAYPDVEETIIGNIKNTNDGRLQIIDLSKQCPTLMELKTSLDKLRELCLPLSNKDLRQTDDSWLSGLESSKWVNYLSQCLQLSLQICKTMRNGTSVIIREHGAADFCAVISSLVHLILDPFYRTKSGFEALIRKEFIVMGHRFLTRLGLIQGNELEECPIFQLFLDCVWQLANQFPSSFEFSETYLTALADSTHLGLFAEFMFDNIYQARKWVRECGKYNNTKFLSVWNFSVQFSDRFQTLFFNPLFEAEKCAVGVRNGVEKDLFLPPDATVPMLSFWSQCYLRWLSPVAILNGGAPAQYFSQCRLTQEIQLLRDELEELETQPELRVKTAKRDFFLSLHSNASSSPRYPSSVADLMTSSFPFTPLSPKEELMAITARTVDRLDGLDDSMSDRNLSVSYSESDCSILDD